METVECRGRGEYIVFLTTENGKAMPVDVDTVTEGDTDYDPKVHVSHFATCTKPDRFRRGRRRK